jgi:hypothetical protein
MPVAIGSSSVCIFWIDPVGTSTRVESWWFTFGVTIHLASPLIQCACGCAGV